MRNLLSLKFRDNWPLLLIGALLVVSTLYFFTAYDSANFRHDESPWYYLLRSLSSVTNGYLLLLSFAVYAVLPSRVVPKSGSFLLYRALLLYTILSFIILASKLFEYIQVNIIATILALVIPVSLLLGAINLFASVRAKYSTSPQKIGLQIIAIMIPVNMIALLAVLFSAFSSYEHRQAEFFGGSWYQLIIDEHRFKCSQQQIQVYQCGFLSLLCHRVFTSERYGCGDKWDEPSKNLPERILLVKDPANNMIYLQLDDETILIAP